MPNYTAIILSSLLLLGNTPSSEALTIGNEVEYNSTFFRRNGRAGVENDSPKRKGNIRAFVNTICISGQEEKDFHCHRGSGR